MRLYGHDDPSARTVNQPCVTVCIPTQLNGNTDQPVMLRLLRKKWSDGARTQSAREEPVFGEYFWGQGW